MPDEKDPPEVPDPEPLSETVQHADERIRRSRTLLHWIDELLSRRKPPPKDGDKP